jgi:hypothetical protein
MVVRSHLLALSLGGAFSRKHQRKQNSNAPMSIHTLEAQRAPTHVA